MSQGREVAHLGVINNSHRDHRDYTDRTAEGKKSQSTTRKKERRRREKQSEGKTTRSSLENRQVRNNTSQDVRITLTL